MIMELTLSINAIHVDLRDWTDQTDSSFSQAQ